MTDEEFNAMLYEAFRQILPDVYEGVYVGRDVDKYITFTYYARGVMYANNRPTAQVRQVTATLWVRNGVSHWTERREMMQAIVRLCGKYPERIVATNGMWKQYVYEFPFVSGTEEELFTAD